jgi:hypothetical protein
MFAVIGARYPHAMIESVAHDVLLPDDLEARVRAWAEAHQLKRSEAIRQLVEAGLGAIEDDD